MWFRLNDWNDSPFDDFRRQIDRLFEERSARHPTSPESERRWTGFRFDDDGGSFEMTVDLPGVRSEDIELDVNAEAIALRVARKADLPEGYTVHRHERAPFRFARSFRLPTKIDPEKVAAQYANGTLTVRLEKAPEAQPRRITVGA